MSTFSVPSRNAPKPHDYYCGLNQALLRAVPSDARVILDVGCGRGCLGAQLKQLDRSRRVIGVERESGPAAAASAHLDEVLQVDIERADLSLADHSVDCVIFGDILEHLYDPETVLRRTRRLLTQRGVILCSVPNIQHHTVITDLLKGEFQYSESGLLDWTHVRFFTYASFTKLLLNAGFLPEVLDRSVAGERSSAMKILRPALRRLRVPVTRAEYLLTAYQYIFRASLAYSPACCQPKEFTRGYDVGPLTFVVCVSDKRKLRTNFLSSPCIQGDSPHEVLTYHRCTSAADAMNRALASARNETVVWVHQDVFLPRGWIARFQSQLEAARSRFGQLGVIGVFGTNLVDGQRQHVGRVVDRDRLLDCGLNTPQRVVDTLDELLLAIPKSSNLRFDPALGFHLYGADVCLAAAERALAVVVVDAPCFHNSDSAGPLPADYYRSARELVTKRKAQLPIGTPCALLDRRWRNRSHYWGARTQMLLRRLKRRASELLSRVAHASADTTRSGF